jgi:hypothetical protein
MDSEHHEMFRVFLRVTMKESTAVVSMKKVVTAKSRDPLGKGDPCLFNQLKKKDSCLRRNDAQDHRDFLQ